MVREVDGGIVRRVVLLDDADGEVEPVSRFLSHLSDSNYSPNTVCAYAYDLRHLATFLDKRHLGFEDLGPATAMELPRLPAAGPEPPSRSAPGTGGRDGAGPVAVAGDSRPGAGRDVEPVRVGDRRRGLHGGWHPMQRQVDPVLGRVPDRPQPFLGGASRQQPVRRTVRVRLPVRLPRPLGEEDVQAVLDSLRTARDLAIFLLMLDGGLRPGEVLCLQLEDLAYGRRRVTVRKRDDHPRGARAKARRERVVDLHEPRTLEAVSRYVLHERPVEAVSPFVFLVGGTGKTRCEPLSYQALVRGFARRLDRLGIRSPEKTPHALRHTHATAMWEGGMRELALQQRAR